MTAGWIRMIGQVTAVQFFVNGATTRTRGIDWVSSYLLDLDQAGKLNLSLSANYNKTEILEVSDPNFRRASQGLLTDATPRTKYVLSAEWDRAGWSVRGDATRYGAVTRRGNEDDGSQDQTFAARWLLNVSTSYTWRDLTFSVGVDNLTNQYPTRSALNNVYEDRPNGLQYSSLSPFGFNGRYWFGRVSYRF
jgi:iron complex outermembrane receptor protein